MPDNIEAELYQHVVWLCENRYPASWDSVKAIAWQLGKIAGMQGEEKEEWGKGECSGVNTTLSLLS